MLRTSWLWAWTKYSFLTLECKHLNFTEIPAKQTKTTWDLHTNLHKQFAFLAKSTVTKVWSYTLKDKILKQKLNYTFRKIQVFLLPLEVRTSYIIGILESLSHWLKERSIFPQGTLHRQAWTDWFAGAKDLTFAYHNWYHKM